MGDCEKVIEYLKQALTPGELDMIEEYIERYGATIGIAVLIVDALRGGRKAKQEPDIFSAIFDELNKMASMAVQQALSSVKNKAQSNTEQVVVQVLDPQELLSDGKKEQVAEATSE